MYGITKSRNLYKINESNGDSILIGNTGIFVAGLAINPSNGELWASIGSVFGQKKDKIYKINKATADTIYVGNTGNNKVTNAIAFDNFGNLYGIVGSDFQVNSLVKIDTLNASITTVGSIGYKGIKGLALLPSLTDVTPETVNNGIPEKFELKQNYPNPFNPATTIEYALPFDANVKITVINSIGEEISVLEDDFAKAGYHKIQWNAAQNGNKLSSGIYIYRIDASDINGKQYKMSKKMILLK